MNLLRKLPWLVPIIGSLTLGLAPFIPQPHLFEKVQMLFNGELARGIDIFDLFFHGFFPLLLAVKAALSFVDRKPNQ
ncbi:MAG: RND transporter [Calditrichia bacterium]